MHLDRRAGAQLAHAPGMWRSLVIALGCLMGAATVVWLDGRFVHWSEPASIPADPRVVRRAAEPRLVTPEERLDAITRAQVWREPALADGARLPPTAAIDSLSCRFL